MDEVHAEIISTGDEVIGGRILDTNAAFLSRRLGEHGILPAYRTTVGDHPKRFEEVVRRALARARVTIVIGGLGPTDDDLTREVCAKALKKKLVKDPEAESHVRSILSRYGIRCEESEMRQTLYPEGARTIPNTRGTAYGFIARDNGRLLAALSGVPAELEQMAQEHLFPYLKSLFPGLRPWASRILRTFGMSESGLQKAIRPALERLPGITWGITASHMVVTVIISAVRENENQVTSAGDEIREILGEKLFSEDGSSLQETVAGLLTERGLTIAIAESCTGGLVSHLLTEVPGVSASLVESIVSYSNESKVQRLGVSLDTLMKHGAVSEQAATEMAQGVQSATGADIGLATTGIAGPGGGTPEKPVGLVYVSVTTSDDTWTRQFNLTGNRADIKKRTANTALNMTRLTILRKFADSPTG